MQFIIVFVVVIFTFSLTSAYALQNNKEKFIVVLDAGHGGKDPGKNSKYGYKEKDIALKVVLAVGKELEKNPDFKVIYTRKTDVFVELKDRAKIANDANADLFVSIHCNAHHTEAYGTETYVLDLKNTNRNFEVAKAENEVIFLEDDYEKHYGGFNPNSPESSIGISLLQEEYTESSILLASMIEKNFVKKANRKSRGVKQASLWVIHQTAMPSVLIETGFVTNKEEGAYLNSDKGQSEVSQSIIDAIMDYKKILDGNVGEQVHVERETPKEITKEQKEKDAIIDDKLPELIYTNIVFKVQLAATSRKIDPKPHNFNGLKDISREKEGGLFKYFYGYTSDYNKVKQLQIEAESKGYETSFIVAYKDGKRVDLIEAVKTTSN
ncbi:MAG: N-acetylmuramoyl-L-alanine amidase [Gelidibacter sp.]|nr:N-acetylmuramoyl-L-alanine amidase [Gelidibacter sp.]